MDSLIADIGRLPAPQLSAPAEVEQLDDEGTLSLLLDDDFVPAALADRLLAHLEAEGTVRYNEGREASVRLFGRWHGIPRKQVAFGSPGTTYAFSGSSVAARPWEPVLDALRHRLNRLLGARYNFALVNRYAGGRDHMGAHRDDERELDPQAAIGSLSLGAQRDFVLTPRPAAGGGKRRKAGGSGEAAAEAVARRRRLVVPLSHGSLLLMRPPTNRHWCHAVPKRARATGVRINLTFRQMVERA